MKPYIEQRVRDIAAYILETGATVRLAGINSSTANLRY